MVFAAYREHKRKMAAWEREREEEKLRREALRAKRRAEDRAALLHSERARVNRVLLEHGIALPPAVARILPGETGPCSCGCPHCCPSTGDNA